MNSIIIRLHGIHYCWVIFILLLFAGNASADGAYSGQGNRWESEWVTLQKMQANVPVNERIKNVNTYFNRISRVSDQEVWGRQDYWATVTEFLQRGKGDCEDFAIAKYFTLRMLGIADADLRLAYGKVLTPGRGIEPHMVLLYLSPGGDTLVLDNINSNIHALHNRNDLIIQYVFNSRSLWDWSEGNMQTLIGSADALPQWASIQKNNTLVL